MITEKFKKRISIIYLILAIIYLFSSEKDYSVITLNTVLMLSYTIFLLCVFITDSCRKNLYIKCKLVFNFLKEKIINFILKKIYRNNKIT